MKFDIDVLTCNSVKIVDFVFITIDGLANMVAILKKKYHFRQYML